MEKSRIRPQLVAGFAVSMAAINMGFAMGWASPSLPKLLADDSDIRITSDQSSWIASALQLGGMAGPFIGAAMVNRYGRKLSLLCTTIPFIIAYIITGMAHSYWWLLIARFVAGLGMASVQVVAPIYLGEIADDRIRGALGTMLTVMSNSGILLVYSIGPWISREVLAAVGGVLPLIFGLMFVWMPETPYFLIMTDKPDRAEKSLLWLKGTGSVSEELRQVRESVEFDKKNAATMKDLVLVAGNRKALIIVLGLILAQQLSGIVAILSYSALIFEASGSTLDTNISVIIIGVIQLLSTVLTTFTIDLAGRRSLLLLSAGGSILFLGGEAVYFQLQAIGNDVSAISWLPVTAIVAYIICYSIGFGSIPYVVLSEIFPSNLKALAAMVVTVIGCGSGLVVAKLYQVVTDAYGVHVSFWGFMVITIFSGIFIYFFVPETKQRSFKNIQEELHKTTESKVELNEWELA